MKRSHNALVVRILERVLAQQRNGGGYKSKRMSKEHTMANKGICCSGTELQIAEKNPEIKVKEES